MNKYTLKCWKPVKTFKPKQNDEICIDGTVTKVEKIKCMTHG